MIHDRRTSMDPYIESTVCNEWWGLAWKATTYRCRDFQLVLLYRISLKQFVADMTHKCTQWIAKGPRWILVAVECFERNISGGSSSSYHLWYSWQFLVAKVVVGNNFQSRAVHLISKIWRRICQSAMLQFNYRIA